MGLCQVRIKEGQHYAWDTLCLPKKEGGMVVRDVSKWNVAFVNKLVWNIAPKADGLWIKWFNHYYLRGTIWE